MSIFIIPLNNDKFLLFYYYLTDTIPLIDVVQFPSSDFHIECKRFENCDIQLNKNSLDVFSSHKVKFPRLKKISLLANKVDPVIFNFITKGIFDVCNHELKGVRSFLLPFLTPGLRKRSIKDILLRPSDLIDSLILLDFFNETSYIWHVKKLYPFNRAVLTKKSIDAIALFNQSRLIVSSVNLDLKKLAQIDYERMLKRQKIVRLHLFSVNIHDL